MREKKVRKEYGEGGSEDDPDGGSEKRDVDAAGDDGSDPAGFVGITSHSMALNWSTPISNGPPVTCYEIEMMRLDVDENEKNEETFPTNEGAKYVASRVTHTVPGVTESRVHAKRTKTTSFVNAATSSTLHKSEDGASGPIQAPALTASASESHMSRSPRLTAGSTTSTRSLCCFRASSAEFVCALDSSAADADEQARRNDTSRSDWSGGR